jgi:hypothetical protein
MNKNKSLAPLHEQKRMQALDVEEMESPSKIRPNECVVMKVHKKMLVDLRW